MPDQPMTTAAGNPLVVPELTDDGIPYFVPVERADTLVRCQRCGAVTEGDTVAQAQHHIWHENLDDDIDRAARWRPAPRIR